MDYCTRVWTRAQHATLDEKRLALEALDITATWHPEWPEPKIEGSLPPEIFTIVTNAAQCPSTRKSSPHVLPEKDHTRHVPRTLSIPAGTCRVLRPLRWGLYSRNS